MKSIIVLILGLLLVPSLVSAESCTTSDLTKAKEQTGLNSYQKLVDQTHQSISLHTQKWEAEVKALEGRGMTTTGYNGSKMAINAQYQPELTRLEGLLNQYRTKVNIALAQLDVTCQAIAADRLEQERLDAEETARNQARIAEMNRPATVIETPQVANVQPTVTPSVAPIVKPTVASPVVTPIVGAVAPVETPTTTEPIVQDQIETPTPVEEVKPVPVPEVKQNIVVRFFSSISNFFKKLW